MHGVFRSVHVFASIAQFDRERISERAKEGLDGPFGAVKFIIEFLKKYNYNTADGVLVATGALTGVHGAVAGDKAEICYEGRCHFFVELVDTSTFNR